MNINIYLESALAESLNEYVKNSGQSRNAIIREAIHDFIQRHEVKKWPDSILNYAGAQYTTSTPPETPRIEIRAAQVSAAPSEPEKSPAKNIQVEIKPAAKKVSEEAPPPSENNNDDSYGNPLT